MLGVSLLSLVCSRKQWHHPVHGAGECSPEVPRSSARFLPSLPSPGSFAVPGPCVPTLSCILILGHKLGLFYRAWSLLCVRAKESSSCLHHWRMINLGGQCR